MVDSDDIIIDTSRVRIYNSLSKKTELLSRDNSQTVGIYSCGPTVYDNIHIGNLFSFVVADQLRRSVKINGFDVIHVMNTTDVDDKTIKRALTDFPNEDPLDALKKVTTQYESVFVEDANKVGIDMQSIKLVRATNHIDQMQTLIKALLDKGIAYIADDGIYFKIEEYSKKHRYGVLTNITQASTGQARVANDEYDKDNVHDFALWKLQEPGEPAWDFHLEGRNLAGRPGWHVECSAMSTEYLGQPFTIHTGGVDLKFPHHENEIAQSTGSNDKEFAKMFVHNEHVLVEGKKMSKSLGNFFTLRDIEAKGFEPMAFRVLTLQSHYSHRLNFSWKSLQAASAFLHRMYDFSDLQFQVKTEAKMLGDVISTTSTKITQALANNLDTAGALAELSELMNIIESNLVNKQDLQEFVDFIAFIDKALGLKLGARHDIDENQKEMIQLRETARNSKDFASADEHRDRLKAQGITIRDTSFGPIWSRV